MKRIVALILLLMMVLPITACGKDDDKKDSDTKDSKPTEQQNPTKGEDKPEDPTPTQAETPTLTVTPTPTVTLTEAPTPTPTQAAIITTGFENGRASIVLSCGKVLSCDVTGEWSWEPEDKEKFGLDDDMLLIWDRTISFKDRFSDNLTWYGSIMLSGYDLTGFDPEDLIQIESEYKGWSLCSVKDESAGYLAENTINNVIVLVSTIDGNRESVKYAIDHISNLKVE